jgi:hypothetical protein
MATKGSPFPFSWVATGLSITWWLGRRRREKLAKKKKNFIRFLHAVLGVTVLYESSFCVCIMHLCSIMQLNLSYQSCFERGFELLWRIVPKFSEEITGCNDVHVL